MLPLLTAPSHTAWGRKRGSEQERAWGYQGIPTFGVMASVDEPDIINAFSQLMTSSRVIPQTPGAFCSIYLMLLLLWHLFLSSRKSMTIGCSYTSCEVRLFLVCWRLYFVSLKYYQNAWVGSAGLSDYVLGTCYLALLCWERTSRCKWGWRLWPLSALIWNQPGNQSHSISVQQMYWQLHTTLRG